MVQTTIAPCGLQALVLAGGSGSRMYPLTESMKKAMLPVGNRPMIWYALQSLEDAGFQEIIVLIRKETEGHNDLYRYLAETYESKSAKAIRVVEIDNDVNGTADALRAAQAHIHAGVLVMSCDLVANVNIRSMVDEWRIRDADVCMALADSLPHERGLENKKNAKGIKDYIGLDVETKTVVYYTPEADVDEELDLSRRMFTQWPRVQLRNDLTDCHLYVMRKWVVDYIVADTTISSLKGDLIPHLVRRQYKRKPATAANPGVSDVLSFVTRTGRLHLKKEDTIRCTYYQANGTEPCGRCNSVVRYSELNKAVIGSKLPKSGNRGENTSVARETKLSDDSKIGDSCTVEGRVSIKNSTVGSHTTIRANVKLNNCVIMDHAEIGAGSILNNTIVCKNAYVQAGCTLKDCQVGEKFVIDEGIEAESESFVNTVGLLSI